MSKFLFYTDAHLSAKRPIHRVDSFVDSLLRKLEEVYEIAAEEGVDFVVFGGDFFNSHRIFNYEIIDEAIQIIDRFGKPTYAIVGQHDLVGYNKDTYRSSTLHFLEKYSTCFSTMWEPVELGDMVLYPCHTFDNFEAAFDVSVSRKKKSVLVAHHLITKETKPYDTYLVSSFTPCRYSMVLFGDYHGGMEMTTAEDGTVVYSPGALARLAISDRNHIVKVGIITCAPKKDIQVKERPLNSALPPEECFGQSILEEIRETADMTDASAFVESILDMEKQCVDVFELIERVAKQQDLREDVLEYILAKRD